MDASQAGIPGFPADARSLELTFQGSYERSLEGSRDALEAMERDVLYHVPETRLMTYGFPGDFIDSTPHGSQASSQIICEEYGMATGAWLVVLRSLTGGSDRISNFHWAAEQAWIDIVHINLQDLPVPLSGDISEAVQALIDSGKLVVIAAGNGLAGAGVNYPMELSRYNGPPGSLIAGANDNEGYAYYSNLNPHIVMDGLGTRAAEPYGYGETSFSGTSSSSPRITGYVAHLLRLARLEHAGDLVADGRALLELQKGAANPGAGPLADGVLSVPELHEIVRKTADPNPHESKYDGDGSLPLMPQPVDLPYSFYPKMGYGEVSEHTLPTAFEVLLGAQELPERPVADEFYERSEQLRRMHWG